MERSDLSLIVLGHRKGSRVSKKGSRASKRFPGVKKVLGCQKGCSGIRKVLGRHKRVSGVKKVLGHQEGSRASVYIVWRFRFLTERSERLRPEMASGSPREPKSCKHCVYHQIRAARNSLPAAGGSPSPANTAYTIKSLGTHFQQPAGAKVPQTLRIPSNLSLPELTSGGPREPKSRNYCVYHQI